MQRHTLSIAPGAETQDDLDFATLANNINSILDEIDASIAPLILTPPPRLPFIDLDAEPLNNDVAEQPRAECPINLFCLLPYLPALASAAKDAAGDALSLFQAGNKSMPLLVTASTVAFLAAFELSGQSTTENLRELTETLRSRKKPNEWPALSYRNVFAVTSVAVLMASWCAFSESTQAYDFVGAIGSDYKITITPGMKVTWAAITIGATVGSGVTKLLTDNYETWKVMWRLTSGERTPYANTASRLITPTVGGSFAVLKAFHDSLQSFEIISSVFGIQSIPAKAVLALACTTDMTSNFCFSGLTVTRQMDELFRYVQHPKYEPAKITAFTVSLSLAIFLSYVKRTLNMGFYQDLASQDFGLKEGTVPDSVFETLSWLVLVAEVMLVTASLNPQMMVWFGHLYDKIGSLLSCMTQPCSTPASENNPADLTNFDATERAEAGVSTTGLFARSRMPESDDLRIPSRSRRSACPPCTLI